MSGSGQQDETASGLAAISLLVDRPPGPAVDAWLRSGSPVHLFGLPLLGLPISPAPDNLWGATCLLQVMRPDLPRTFLALRLLDGRALCAEPGAGPQGETRLVEIDLEGHGPPIDLGLSFEKYLARGEADIARSTRILARAGQILAALVDKGYTYDHAKGGNLPRAHEMRVVRSCVHDLVVGLAALRQDDRRNDTVVDLFECTDHPLYAPGHGVRSLVALILADAYKSGVSMALRFVPVEGLRGKAVPAAFAELAKTLGVALAAPGSGSVSADEGAAMFAALAGLSAAATARAEAASRREAVTVEALSYLILSRGWTCEEVEWVLGAAPRPAATLFGDDGPEEWLGHSEAAIYGNAAILGTMFRASLNIEGEEGLEAAACTARGDTLEMELRRPACSPWDRDRLLPNGHRMTVSARPRAPLAFEASLILADAERLVQAAPPGNEPVLIYNDEFRQLDTASIAERLDSLGVTIVISPYRVADLHEIYEARLGRARRVRR